MKDFGIRSLQDVLLMDTVLELEVEVERCLKAIKKLDFPAVKIPGSPNRVG